MLCFLLLKSMQSQFKTIQPQLKTLRRKKGKNTAELQLVLSFFSCIHTKSQLTLVQFSIGQI